MLFSHQRFAHAIPGGFVRELRSQCRNVDVRYSIHENLDQNTYTLQHSPGGGRPEKGEGRREDGDRRPEKGEGRREDGDRRPEKGEGRREDGDRRNLIRRLRRFAQIKYLTQRRKKEKIEIDSREFFHLTYQGIAGSLYAIDIITYST